MNVKELIEQLAKLPHNAKVFYVWDGEPRTSCDAVYLAVNGQVLLIGKGDSVYSADCLPKDTTLEQVFRDIPA